MELFGILLMSVTMLLGSYVAGCLPLFFTLNEKRIRLTSIFGAGILIGTTLCVIVPEGISAYYEFTSPVEKMPLVLLSPVHNNVNWRESLDRIRRTLENAVKANNDVQDELNSLLVVTAELAKHSAAMNESLPVVVVDRPARTKRSTIMTQHQDGEHHHPNSNSAIGLSLIVGFLFLFVVDHFSKAHAAGRNRSVPTLGLIIHAAADGIAMGSASTAADDNTPMITFFAIMIHKAPTAFALASFLLLEGLEKFRIRQHIMVFSLAAPLATIVTYSILRNMESSTGEATGSRTGLILLFSGGTFLYIAASHVLPELVESKCSPVINNPVPLSGGAPVRPHFSVIEVVIFVGAALLPSLLTSHHHH